MIVTNISLGKVIRPLYPTIILLTLLSIPVQAKELISQLEQVISDACQSTDKYNHHGIKIGMSQNELERLGSEPLKVNFPSSGSSSVLVKDKTYIMWSTPDSPEQPRYRIDYEYGALESFTLEEAQTFIDKFIDSFGEPKIKAEGKGYHNAGYPSLNYTADKQIKKEKFQSISQCFRQNKEISRHQIIALQTFKPNNFMPAFERLQSLCPKYMAEYLDYMRYSLQPEVNVTTGKFKHRVNMKCPAHYKITAILKAANK